MGFLLGLVVVGWRPEERGHRHTGLVGGIYQGEGLKVCCECSGMKA